MRDDDPFSDTPEGLGLAAVLGSGPTAAEVPPNMTVGELASAAIAEVKMLVGHLYLNYLIN